MKNEDIKEKIKIAIFKYHPLKEKSIIYNRMMEQGTYIYDLKYWDHINFNKFGKLLFTTRPKLKLGVEGNCFIMNSMSGNPKDSFTSKRAKKSNMTFPYVVYVDIDFKTDEPLNKFKEDFGEPNDLLLKFMDDKNIWISGHSGGGKGIRIMCVVYNKCSDEHLSKKDKDDDEKYRAIYNSNYSYVLDYLKETYNLTFYDILNEDYIDRAPISNMVLKTHECKLDGYNTVKNDCNILVHETPIVEIEFKEKIKTESKPYTNHQVEGKVNDISFVPDEEFSHFQNYILANAQESDRDVRKMFYEKYVANYSGTGFKNILKSFSNFDDYLNNTTYNHIVPLRQKFIGEYLDSIITGDVMDDIENATEEVTKMVEVKPDLKENLRGLIDDHKEDLQIDKEFKEIYDVNVKKYKGEELERIKYEENLRKLKKKQKLDNYNVERDKLKGDIDKQKSADNLLAQLNIEEKQLYFEKKSAEYIEKIQKKFLLVGNNYFETAIDLDGIKIYKERKTEIIKSRYKLKGFDPIDHIPVFYDFVTMVDNINYKKQVRINGEMWYNKYCEMPYEPKKGKFKYIRHMLEHIFEDKIEFILDYFKLLYMQPTLKLPIIALISKEGDTGKTTFLNFLKDMFGPNQVGISSNQLKSNFNHIFCDKLVITIDETYIDKRDVQEQIKSYVTSTEIVSTEKFMNDRSVNFNAKFVMCSNNEDFTNASETETRYAVFTPKKPKKKIVDINDKMKLEIPAFLEHLLERDMFHKKSSRLWFDEDVYITASIIKLKKNSRGKVLKDMIVRFDETLNKLNVDVLQFTVSDIQEIWFKNNNIDYVRRVLNDDMKLSPSKIQIKYTPISYFSNQNVLNESVKKKGVYTLSKNYLEKLQ